jgi:hypothetical protein
MKSTSCEGGTRSACWKARAAIGGEARWTMARVKTSMVMAVLGALAQARRDASVAKAERVATAWTFNMRRLRLWIR